MTSFWRKSAFAAVFSAAAALTLILFGGIAAANITGVTITSPASRVSVKPGGTVMVGGVVSANWAGDSFNIEVTIGTTVRTFSNVNTTRFGDRAYSVPVDLLPTEPDGLKSIQVVASENEGTPSSASVEAKDRVMVDSIAPVVTVVTTPPSPTNNTKPTWAWNVAETGSGIKTTTVKLNGTSVTPAGSSYTPAAALADGAYVLTVQVEDKAGNVSDKLEFASVTVHATAPVFSNEYPADGYETKDPNLAPHIDITDTGDGVDPDSISWNIAGGIGGTVEWSAPTSTFTPYPALSGDGYFGMKVTASDLIGNKATYPSSGTWSFLLDTTAPELKSVTLSDRQRDVGGKVYTDNTWSGIKASVVDANNMFTSPSGFNVSGTLAISVYADAARTEPVLGTCTPETRPTGNTDPWSATWTPTDELAAGDYYVKVTATDDAGNTASFIDFSFIVDTAGPSGSGKAEVGVVNEKNGKRFTNSRYIMATWDASIDPALPDGAAGSGTLGYALEVWTKAEGDSSPTGTRLYVEQGSSDTYDQSILAYLPSAGSGRETWANSLPLPFVSGKSYGVWLMAYDMLHNQSDWFDPPFIFDVDAPTDPGSPDVTGIDPVSRRTRIATPTLEWTHSTDDQVGIAQSGVDLYEVQVSVAGADAWVSTEIDIPDEDVDEIVPDNPLSGTFSWSFPNPLGDGSYNVRVRAKDVAGNYSGWATMAAFMIDTAAPGVPGMPTTTSPTNNAKPTWTWTGVSDPDFHHYNIYEDGVRVVSAPATATYTPTAALADGLHVLEVTSVDNLGNESAKSTAGHVVVDTTGPLAPAAPRATSPTTSIAQLWEWDYVEDAASFEVQTSLDGVTWSAAIPVSSSLSCVTSFTGDGVTGYLRVRAYDALGNVGYIGNPEGWSIAGSVFVDTVAPDAPTNLATSPARINHPNPVWTWTAPIAVDLASYEVRLDGGAPVNIGLVTTYTASNVGEGVHWLEVRALDALGNPSGWAGPVSVEVDMMAPAVPTAPWTTSPTSSTTQDWSWEDVDDLYLDRYDVRVDGGSAVDNGLLTTYQTNLGPGVHYLQVRAVDDVGNISAWSERGYVTVDTTNPVTPIMAALPPYTNKNKVTFVWSAVVDASKYELQYSINGIPASPVEPVLLQAFELDISGCVDGDVIRASVRAYDAAGNAGDWSNEVQTIVDRTAPTVTMNSMTSPTTNPTPLWTWTAAAWTVAPVDHYVVFLDFLPGIETIYSYYLPSFNLPDGTHVLMVYAIDEAGNESEPVASMVEIDTTVARPTAPVASPNPTNTIPVWVWDPVTDVNGPVTYNVYLDGVLAAPALSAITWSPVLRPADGAHYLQIEAIDGLGNISPTSEKGWVIIDTAAPSVPIMTELPEYTNATSVTFSWTAVTDAVSYIFRYYKDGVQEGSDIGTTSNGYVVDISGWLDGERISADVVAVDAAGNQSDPSDEVGATVDRTAPEVIADNPTVPMTTQNARPTWEWHGNDDFNQIVGSGVAYYMVTLDGEWMLNTVSESFTPASKLAEGDHVLRVGAVDNAGNVGEDTIFATVIIDTTAPEVPGMPKTTSPANNPSPVWTWGAVANAAKYRVFEDEVDKGFVTEPTYTSANLTEGTHYLQVTALDALGNESAKSEAGYVVIDLTPPAVPLMKALPLFTKDATLTFEWSASDTAVKYELSYSKNGGTSWTEAPNLTAQSRTVNIADVADGIAVLGKVRAYDGIGNVSEYSGAVQTTIDRTGPVVAITDPTEEVTTNSATFTYEWTAVDAGCGVKSCTVVFNGGEHQVTATTGEGAYAWTGTLIQGNDNTFEVWATDKLGNVGEPKVAPIVKQMMPEIGMVQPLPGAEYKINEISTIAFQVVGLSDGPVEVSLNLGGPLEPWRVVTVMNTPTMAKFYVLLDGDVLVPGRLDVKISVGAASLLSSYMVDSERSGFGFGRLRPW